MPAIKKRPRSPRKKLQPMTMSPALLVATVISARHSGDTVLETGAKADLLIHYGVNLDFAEDAKK